MHNFGSGYDGGSPTGSFIQVTDSLLYGLTNWGGVHDLGTIFSFNIFTDTETVLFSFNNPDGYAPQGSLMLGSNGLLYGMNFYGSSLFSYDRNTSAYTILHRFFTDSIFGRAQASVIQANDGLIYGMTTDGGTHYAGTIFSYNIVTDSFHVLHNFGANSDGKLPEGSFLQASNGLLYGMTYLGGTDSSGTIFSYNPLNGNYTVVHNFRTDSDGISPWGSLIQANNGLLYGMTLYGGPDTSGTIFSYNTNTGAYNTLHNFGLGIDGAYPLGDLLEVDFPTSIPKLSSSFNLQIYPNPSAGQFTIQLPNNQSISQAIVYNTLGQKIEQLILTASQNTIDLSNQPAGMYFISVQTETGTIVSKVIVDR